MADNALPLIPSMPKEPFMVKDILRDAYVMHPAWLHYHSQINTVLQTRLSHEGFKVTQQPTSNINAMNTFDKSESNFLYNSETGKMNLCNRSTTTGNNIYKEVSTKPEQLTAVQIAAIPASEINGTWVVNSDNGKLFFGINNAFREVAYTP